MEYQEDEWILDRYQKISILGEGAMGVVYKAYDITLQRDVAVKVMRGHIANRPYFQERFLQEARATARLDHPGIVQVFDVGSHHNLLYIVMKFIAGDNLEKLLDSIREKNEWITVKESVFLIQQVALALDYAHRQRVLHRDIKPSNIMIEPTPGEGRTYRAVITDLGLAKLTESGLTTMENVIGTPAYMSPEHALGGKTDARSDVYSMGVLLYKLITGRLPYPIENLQQAAVFHSHVPPHPLNRPGALCPGLPASLEDVILTAMQRDPEKRFASARLFADALVSVDLDALGDMFPTSFGNATDLLTVYGQSVIGALSVEKLGPPPPLTPTSKSLDRIQIIERDGTTSLAIVRPEGMTIGRVESCDLILNDRKASRMQARVEYDGINYRITDLNSANGTYLGAIRLTPGVREIWQPNELVRIGSAHLRLLRVQVDWHDFVMIVDDAPVGIHQIHRNPGEGRVGVYIAQTNLSVDPGAEAVFSIHIANLGTEADRFRVQLEGVPPSWKKSEPLPTLLKPGDQRQVRMRIQPPRTVESRAGRYPIAIRVSSLNEVDQTVVAKATLTVTTFYKFHSELTPARLSAGQQGRITIENQGNAPEIFKITWASPQNRLQFTPETATLNIPIGKSAIAEFGAGERRRRWIGPKRKNSYTTTIRPTKGDSQALIGEVDTGAVLPVWVVAPVLLLLLLLFSFLNGNPDRIGGEAITASPTEFVLVPVITLTPSPTETHTATVTETVFLSPTTDFTRALQETQTVEALIAAQNATIAAQNGATAAAAQATFFMSQRLTQDAYFWILTQNAFAATDRARRLTLAAPTLTETPIPSDTWTPTLTETTVTPEDTVTTEPTATTLVPSQTSFPSPTITITRPPLPTATTAPTATRFVPTSTLAPPTGITASPPPTGE